MRKHLLSALVALSLLAPVSAEPIPTGLYFEVSPIVWEECDSPGRFFLSLEIGLETKVVAILMRTPGGRYEVFGGWLDPEQGFALEEFLGYIEDPYQAPAIVLAWLTGRKVLG